jgi:hypothetical protein
MSTERKWFLVIGTLLASVCLAATAQADQGDATIRWDLIRGDAQGNLRAGGTQSAAAADKSTLALTGSGTFQLGDREKVTGGGTWKVGNEQRDLPGHEICPIYVRTLHGANMRFRLRWD